MGGRNSVGHRRHDPATILQANALSGIDVSEMNAAFIDTKRNPVLDVRPVVSANASIIKPVSQSFSAASFLNLHQAKRPQACDVGVLAEHGTDDATEASVPQDRASAKPVTDFAFDEKPWKRKKSAIMSETEDL